MLLHVSVSYDNSRYYMSCHVGNSEADIKTRHNELEITLRVDQQEAQTHVHCAP